MYRPGLKVCSGGECISIFMYIIQHAVTKYNYEHISLWRIKLWKCWKYCPVKYALFLKKYLTLCYWDKNNEISVLGGCLKLVSQHNMVIILSTAWGKCLRKIFSKEILFGPVQFSVTQAIENSNKLFAYNLYSEQSAGSIHLLSFYGNIHSFIKTVLLLW